MRALALIPLLAASAQAQPALVPLVENGPQDARVNVVVVAEGYTESQRTRFEDDADRLVGALFATPPYDRYRAFFNAYALAVASAEAGADDPSAGIFRDTYFDAAFDCAGTARLICISAGGQSRLDALLRDLVPAYDVVILLVNDPQYGGSGGRIAIASTNTASAEIAIHEVGHSFARLADEYGGSGSGFDSRNTTTRTQRQTTPWRVWIEDETPLPTPDTPTFDGVVGLFEGAAYADQGAYRPERFCKMRTLGSAFCAVCHEHHIGAIYDLVSPIAGAMPAAEAVAIEEGGSLTFEVEALVPSDRLGITWTVDGVAVGASETSVTLAAADLPVGTSEVAARVTDTTDKVRDPGLLPLLSDTRRWTVTRSGVVGTEAGPGGGTRLGVVVPNPVRGRATFSFGLAGALDVRLSVLDALGREVAVVVDGPRGAGPHEVAWSASGLPAGVYVLRLAAPGAVLTRTLTVAR